MPTEAKWRALVVEQFQQSIAAPTQFFNENADRIAQASCAMAQRFERGGRLLVFGNGGSTTDAQHVAVEFAHPVIVGKRALTALALTNDVASVLGLAQQGIDDIFARQIRLLGSRDDIALGLTLNGQEKNVWQGLTVAQEMGMLTIGMSGANAAPAKLPDFYFQVASANPHVAQEVQETAYHILWETVHIFFEPRGLLEETSV